MARSLDPDSPLHPWLIGNNLKSGILPLVALGICSALSKIVVRIFPPAKIETSAPGLA